MRSATKMTGILSYAGLEPNALWAKAKRFFAQTDEEIPERFSLFLPIFPCELVRSMPYVGAWENNRARVSPAGFSTSPTDYFRMLWEDQPELFTDDNFRRNFDYEGHFRGGGEMTVDRTWATLFPQYQPFLGERLVLYMLGCGHQAAAVPESLYPRGGGILRGAELDLRITSRCEHYLAFVKQRLNAGDKYNTLRFETDYLKQYNLTPLVITQAELGRAMQDLCIIKTLQGEQTSAALFTENAKRAEHIPQYVPYRYACDTFESVPITRSTARLLQLCNESDDFVSDLWLPYQDASEYIDRQHMTLDVRALCEGFQIAPNYDPETGGGRYPNQVRVVIVRDRDIRPMTADTLNNPAYGSGMSPQGAINKRVFLSESAELLRQHKLSPEEVHLGCENTDLSPAEYSRMQGLAALQEQKGKLIDAMYRRESALTQLKATARAYDRAKAFLDEKVAALYADVQQCASQQGGASLSGYDADLDYLRRLCQDREVLPDGATPEPLPFAMDTLRELSIESGYAMRNTVGSFTLSALMEK
ncbi:MAG: hypothetical protein RR821_07165 [Clostridia bacterium]